MPVSNYVQGGNSSLECTLRTCSLVEIDSPWRLAGEEEYYLKYLDEIIASTLQIQEWYLI
jgi:hypothetical protein